VLLSCKQAAFIQNPHYRIRRSAFFDLSVLASNTGKGPDIFTIGHNPFVPNLELCHTVTLRSDTRDQFLDEVLYEKLYFKSKPLTGPLLRDLSQKSQRRKIRDANNTHDDNNNGDFVYGIQHIDPSSSNPTSNPYLI
jgi:hypothetical protein